MSKKLLFAAIASILATGAYATSSTVTSKDYVDNALETKQDTIETGLVDFNDGIADLPAIVTYDSTDGVTGNKIGILDYQTVFDDEGSLNLYSYSGGYGSEMDNYVPTVRAVAEEVRNILASIPSVPPLTWNSTTDTAAVNNYSTTFNSTTNNWPTAQSTQYVRGAVLANALALKQNKLPAQDTNLIVGQQVVQSGASSVIAPTSTPGVVQQVALWDADGLDPAAWDINDYYGENTVAERNAIRKSIPTVGAVANALALKQNKIPAGTNPSELYTNGSVLTYTNTAGTIGEKYIIDPQVFDELINGQLIGEPEEHDYRNMLVTAGEVQDGLGMKQKKLGGDSSKAGKVVTATATAGNVTYTAIDGTVTNASNNLVTSGAVYTAVNARQAKKTCAGWMDGTTVPDATHTDANCVLWNLPD